MLPGLVGTHRRGFRRELFLAGDQPADTHDRTSDQGTAAEDVEDLAHGALRTVVEAQGGGQEALSVHADDDGRDDLAAAAAAAAAGAGIFLTSFGLMLRYHGEFLSRKGVQRGLLVVFLDHNTYTLFATPFFSKASLGGGI